jgi:hypothetical protein
MLLRSVVFDADSTSPRIVQPIRTRAAATAAKIAIHRRWNPSRVVVPVAELDEDGAGATASGMADRGRRAGGAEEG